MIAKQVYVDYENLPDVINYDDIVVSTRVLQIEVPSLINMRNPMLPIDVIFAARIGDKKTFEVRWAIYTIAYQGGLLNSDHSLSPEYWTATHGHRARSIDEAHAIMPYLFKRDFKAVLKME